MGNKNSIIDQFPLSNKKGSTMECIDKDLMYNIVDDVTPLTQLKFEEIIKGHKKFIEANGGNGKWMTFTQSGLVFATYHGLPVEDGIQGKFYLQKIEGLNFNRTYLPFCDFIGCLGEKINFKESNLKYSIFTDARISGSNFEGSDLKGVDFSRSDLSNCCFDNTNLEQADFENCNLQGASFIGAKMDSSRFPGVNLENVKY